MKLDLIYIQSNITFSLLHDQYLQYCIIERLRNQIILDTTDIVVPLFD